MILLDSHAVVWWLASDPKLPASLDRTIRELPGVFVSVASVWEIEIKRRAGKLDSPPDLLDQLDQQAIRLVEIDAADAVAAAALPRLHGDPFDRMLVAQAGRRGLSVATRDRRLSAYGVTTLWG